MGSPPQGYIASQVVAGNFAMRRDANGDLGVFDAGLQCAAFVHSPTNGEFRVFDPTVGASSTRAMRLLATSSGRFNVSAIDGTNITDIGISAVEGNALFRASVGRYFDIVTAGKGLAPIYGIDNRTGIVAADGAPITLYAVPTGAGQLYRITADIFATVVSAGTANYTVTWTENAQAKTMPVAASVVNTLGTATDLINPDASTNITAQLTFAGFTGTVKVASVVEQLA